MKPVDDPNIAFEVSFSLPTWVNEMLALGTILEDENSRMQAAIDLSLGQAERGTGGPFGAILCELETGRVVGRGVNVVVPSGLSSLHAEVVAWSNAQYHLGTYDLGEASNASYGLYTSAQMCVSCWGGIFWTGITRVVAAATGEDVESIVGFDEGPIPEDWKERLESRGISVSSSSLRDQAVRALHRYVERGGEVYNSRKGKS